MRRVAGMPAPVVACAALVASLLLAGCGGGGSAVDGSKRSGPPLTKTAYEARVADIVKSLKTKFGNVSSDPTKLSKTNLAKVQSGLHYLADRLERLDPPAEVRDLHDRFVSAVRAFADELPDLMQKVQKDPSAGLDAVLGSKPFASLLAVSQAFRKKGYDVQLSG